MEKEKKRDAVENDSNLPQELLEKILSKLPYRSQCRFKCVCKFWNSLLTSPVFVPPHLSDFIKCHSSDHGVILKFSVNVGHELFSLSGNDYSDVKINIPFFCSNCFVGIEFKISGHCNGILCLSEEHGRTRVITLYNPATRQFKTLPNSVMWNASSSTPAVGIGYDSRSDDYKVVRINMRAIGVANSVDEYSLRTDSWRPLVIRNANDFLIDHSDNDCFAVFFKGTYYWMAYSLRRMDHSSKMILRLNMGSDVFLPVPEPRRACTLRKLHSSKLAVWKEWICLIYCYDCGGMMSRMDMWVMNNEFGGGVSWTKMRSMERIPFGRVQPLVFWKGNELLLQTYDGEIKSYNVDTEENKNIKLKERLVPGSRVQAVNYVATLVSIKGPSSLT